MMVFDNRRAQSLASQAQTSAQILGGAPEPGMFSGVLTEPFRGIERGAAKVQGALAAGLGQVAQPMYDAVESTTGTKPLNIFESWAANADARARSMAPDPMTTGAAGQLLNGLGDVLAQVGIGSAVTALSGGTAPGAVMAGGAATAGLSTGRATYSELKQKGVDASTALNAGFVDAVMTGAGVAMPAAIGFSGMAAPVAGLGLRLTQPAYYGANAALGAGANVAMGITQRSALHDVLQSAGYEAMATQYAPIDAAASTAEAVLGGVFGLVGARAGLPMRARDVVDGAMVARDARHAAIDTAPGVPADPATAVAHNRALDEATRATWEGRRVDVSQTGVDGGEFLPRFRDRGPSDGVRQTHLGDLRPEDRFVPSVRLRDMGAAERASLRFDAQELNEYAAHVERENGLPAGIINALKNAGERSNSNQVSPAGARGVMQFMPENLKKYGVTDPTDPAQMIDAAGRYLRDTARQYGGNVDAMVADYNGGPRQAREVLAGRQPKAEETRKYLARVREWLGRDSWSDRTRPSDRLSSFPEERARTAAALEREISTVEDQRADLFADASGRADLGQVAAIRDELADLQQRRAAVQDDDAGIRARAKEIQARGPFVSYKRALTRARDEIQAQVQDLDSQIQRVDAALSQNREASQALQRLAALDDEIATLRENRTAVDAPAVEPTPLAAALRDAMPDYGGRNAAEAEPGTQPFARRLVSALQDFMRPRASTAPDGGARPPLNPPQAQPDIGPRSGAPAVSEGRGRASGGRIDDLETRVGLALIEEQGDIVLPVIDENGNEVQLSLREALAEADAELAYARPEAFDAAILCQLKGGV
ncbi:hypothetical protein CEY09_05375 [Achromobacter marplatensis]|uniref:Transglycosylase-like protein with SLT domain n=1 Tax=Achromobacter marplatensis TaxID=470868 RepID=A0ABX9GE49_9BURK|nr:transglycosylase SLT domain-containing protein [Achromobacter marplatensis]OWT71001.1 hypothetical protein CEY09_05375 [Achromobacter marplatensis]RBP22620.1 transglycosylase-like protein with SLT domain [Achromobacter marplatensis]CAB3648578.1 hypothetical protein LMG26219_02630 [Achromobacter marplatensis]